MADQLEDVCGLPDLSSANRRRLRAELDFAADLFARIDRGASFCEDRGFGWTAAMERAEGSDRLFAAMRAWPILRRLLPQLRHYRHQIDPVFGTFSVPTQDLVVARLLVEDRWSFQERDGDWRDGEGPGECQTVVRLEAKAVLAQRMRQAVVPCDLCGLAAQSLSIAGTVLTIEVPGIVPERSEIPAECMLPLQQAMAAQDMPAIRALDPAWVKRYRAERDALYCDAHVE